MKLRFIFLGKKNTSFLELLIKEYLKRLNKYVKSEYIFIDEKNSVKLEQKIIKQVKSRDYMIVLDEKGQTFTTVEYAKLLKKTLINFSSIIFIVGDAYSVPKSISNHANTIFSLSKMTFPHMIARLIILEQTYRSFCILNNHPYHHE